MSTLRADAPAFEFSPKGTSSFFAPSRVTDFSNVYSIDVECVATGWGNRDRSVARVACVGPNEETLFDCFVKPSLPVTSYLTPLTGITKADLVDAPSLEEAKQQLKKILPSSALLVGQSIKHDIDWLGLVEKKDFASNFDVSTFFRAMIPQTKRVVTFSLRHEVLYLSGFEGAGTDIQAGAHSPVIDALFSVRLYRRFCNAELQELAHLKSALLQAPRTLPFWKTTPYLDGVAMGPPWATPVLSEEERAQRC